MWQEANRQRSFAEQANSDGNGRNARLQKIDQMIDWAALERELAEVHSKEEGRPAYRPLLLFKALLLQQWYQLSDPGLEEALADRLSFRRFVRLGLEARVPDHSTVSRFRDCLGQGDLGKRLLAEVNRQLAEKGLVLRHRTILDATVVEAAVKPPPDSRPGEGSRLDPDARWRGGPNKSGGRTKPGFGYKAHVAMDQKSELVTEAVLTPANVNESEVADQLISGQERWVYADKAYDKHARRELLARLGVGDGSMRRAPYGKAHNPPADLVARNRALSGTRAAVERVFARMKLWYGYRRVRYRGLTRNSLQLFTMCVALNLRRAVLLSAA